MYFNVIFRHVRYYLVLYVLIIFQSFGCPPENGFKLDFVVVKLQIQFKVGCRRVNQPDS